MIFDKIRCTEKCYLSTKILINSLEKFVHQKTNARTQLMTLFNSFSLNQDCFIHTVSTKEISTEEIQKIATVDFSLPLVHAAYASTGLL